MRRKIALILIIMCASGAAGCSGGGAGGAGGHQSSGSPTGGTEQVMTVLRQLSRCIRSHGMPGWPDPVINPLTNQPDYPPGAPRLPPGIQQACQSIASRLPPQAQSSQPPTAASMQGLIRFARCLRSHGLANWPDPNTLGEFPMTQQMAAQFKGQADQSAVRACIRFVPGGSEYLQFVGTAGPQPAPGSGNG
ncbi:MAG TPA: hypothetical protein VIX86_23425 [Streptosporangiaceae bacterium]